MYSVSVNINYLGKDRKAAARWVRRAEDVGVSTFWIPETTGRDSFSVLTELALCTNRAHLGTAIVNVYSRTAGALAQHFATLQELSNGRAIAGIGTSGPKVIEGFHGVRFEPALTRLSETTQVLKAYLSGERVDFQGKTVQVHGFGLGIGSGLPGIPIMHGTLSPKSVELTAELADGWLPIWIPMGRLSDEVGKVRSRLHELGRNVDDFTVRAPGDIVVADHPQALAQERNSRRARLAFFVARNGDFYFNQFVRHELADEAAAIRKAWTDSGREAAAQMISDELLDEFDFVGDIDACRERIARQEAAGVTMHQVALAGGVESDPRLLERLLV